MQLTVGYPGPQDEEALLRLRHVGVAPATLADVRAVASADQLTAVRAEVDAVTVTDPVIAYVAALVRRTRELPAVVLGASPRAGVHLLAAARAWACLNGRTYVVPDDVAALASPVLHHRLILTPEAELDRFTPEQALQSALSTVPIPR
jgi:MoxR-like ATPase